MKFRLHKKVIATFILIAVAFGGWYASKEYWIEDYELKIRIQRDAFRDPEVSEDLVIVGIDFKSYMVAENQNISRTQTAKIIDNLSSYGAERIFFDIWYPKSTNQAETQVFANALKNSKAEIFLPVHFANNESGGFTTVASDDTFHENANKVVVDVYYNTMGQVEYLPYRYDVNGLNIKSISAEIAGRDGAPNEWYPIDFAFDWKKIPTYSAIDVLEGKISPEKLKGKTILFGKYTKQFGDHYMEPGGGLIPGMAVHAIGANQLMKARPVVVDKWIPIAIAVAVSILIIWAFINKIALFLSAFSIPALFAFSVFLDSRFIVLENLPAFILFLACAIYSLSAIYIDRLNESRLIDRETGIPNRDALIEDMIKPQLQTIICMNMESYNMVRRSLSSTQLHRLLDIVKKRLSPITEEIFQGSDGSLYFGMSTQSEKEIMDSLTAIKTFFLNPIELDSHMLNLRPAFGFDMEYDLQLDDRLSHSLVASAHAQQLSEKISKYIPTLLEEEKLTVSLQDTIAQAMQNGELEIYVQPQMCLAEGWICSGEALIRWNNPSRGIVGPAEFMPVIEKTPLINAFTIHVINLAIVALPKILNVSPDFKLSINVPPILMTNTQFLDEAYEAINRSDVENSVFVLEITERGVLVDKEIAKSAMQRFVDAGINLSIDDFGTENANIEILRSIPATELKIDRSFIKDVCESPQDKALVESVINMAHRLDYSVVAEGVENREILDLLGHLGCDKAQGFYLAKPLKVSDFTGYLMRDRVHRNIQKKINNVKSL